MSTIRVALIDDHTLFREGTRELLERDGDVEVVGEAADGRAGIELVETLVPDLALIDMEMPEVGGIELTRHIKDAQPDVSVVALTVHDEEPLAFAVLEAGADGYLLKDVDARELLDAVHRVHAGESVLHPVIVRQVLARVREGGDRPPVDRGLTADERQVLLLATRGMTNREIADELCVSPRTVQQRLTRVFAELKVGSRTEAAIRALQNGLFTLEDL